MIWVCTQYVSIILFNIIALMVYLMQMMHNSMAF